MSAQASRLQSAIEAIDAANAGDPVTVVVGGEERPRELAHAELASEWLDRLVDAPSEELRLAVRAHHLRRWETPRSDYPAGRAGYRRWRKSAQAFHAEQAAEVLADTGYPADAIARVAELIRKAQLDTDLEAQVLEDTLCLVFLEMEFEGTAEKFGDEDKLVRVLARTLAKMSSPARALASELALTPGQRGLLARAQDRHASGRAGE